MRDTRASILHRIRTALHRTTLTSAQETMLAERTAAHPRGIIPQRVNIDQAQLMTLFIQQAKQAAASVEYSQTLSNVPVAIDQFLQAQKTQKINSLRVANSVASLPIPWKKTPSLHINFGDAKPDDKISLTDCLCGVAETGTLVLPSGPHCPTLLNFLPEIHIVLLSTTKIVRAYEDAWDLVRKNALIPRRIHFITGPSRTGDIEQKILLGVHGPKQLHIILYDY